MLLLLLLSGEGNTPKRMRTISIRLGDVVVVAFMVISVSSADVASLVMERGPVAADVTPALPNTWEIAKYPNNHTYYGQGLRTVVSRLV